MSARHHQAPRAGKLYVRKEINGETVTLYREDAFLQDKSKLYNAFKKIESGKLALPIHNGVYKIYKLMLDGTLKTIN